MNKLSFEELPKAVLSLQEKLDSIENLIINFPKQLNEEEHEKLLTVTEAAEFLNLTVPTIYSKVSRGELPFMKRSKRLYFSNIELLEYIKKGRAKTNTEIEEEASKFLTGKKRFK
jgi:excisionase family DNA binding protein